MKKVSYLLAIVTAVGVLGAASLTACTVNTTNNGTDGGTTVVGDASTNTDTGTQADTGTKSDTGTDTGAGTCGLTVFGGTCDQCLNTKCCDTFSACFTSPADAGPAGSDCNQLDDCLGACIQADAGGNGSPCVQACAQAHPNSVAIYNAFQQCGGDQCTSSCQ